MKKKEYDGVRNMMSNSSKKRERKEVESQFCFFLQINPIIFDRGNGRV